MPRSLHPSLSSLWPVHTQPRWSSIWGLLKAEREGERKRERWWLCQTPSFTTSAWNSTYLMWWYQFPQSHRKIPSSIFSLHYLWHWDTLQYQCVLYNQPAMGEWELWIHMIQSTTISSYKTSDSPAMASSQCLWIQPSGSRNNWAVLLHTYELVFELKQSWHSDPESQAEVRVVCLSVQPLE